MMEDQKRIQSLYTALCTTCVLEGVLKTPVLHAFMQYAEASGLHEQLKRYSAFVNQIYQGGGNLTDCVRRAVFEDENVYVTARAADSGTNAYIHAALVRELQTLATLVTLTAADFAADMETALPLAEFASGEADLCAEYEARVADIGKHGYGMFASNGMFRLSDTGEHRIEPIFSADRISLDSFTGYREERQRVIDNTQAFVSGGPAANVLLYGDAGTGKSSTVKAVANAFYEEGIRLIEMRKDQMSQLPLVMEKISRNPLKFIIFIDDLSFNRNDDTFSMLKAALEGSASAKAPNAVIYATSNRRHIVRESFGEREGDDVHRNDTTQELLSLSARFGLTVQFGKPDKKLYLEIVRELARKHEIQTDINRLEIEAEAFALRRGHRSPRCAEQFINSLLSGRKEPLC